MLAPAQQSKSVDCASTAESLHPQPAAPLALACASLTQQAPAPACAGQPQHPFDVNSSTSFVREFMLTSGTLVAVHIAPYPYRRRLREKDAGLAHMPGAFRIWRAGNVPRLSARKSAVVSGLRVHEQRRTVGIRLPGVGVMENMIAEISWRPSRGNAARHHPGGTGPGRNRKRAQEITHRPLILQHFLACPAGFEPTTSWFAHSLAHLTFCFN